jgi:hypothetical protein
MIRPRYTLKLARTKLRSKRGMLLASTIIASLLFAALIACIIVFTAAEKSANDFIKKAGNDKYLVQVRPYIPHEVLGYTRDFSLEEIRGIKAFEIEYYNNLEEKYKAAGVAYDKSAETSVIIPDIFKSESLPAEQRVTIDRQSPVADAWFAKKLRDYSITAPNTLQKLKELGSTYGASGYYIQIQTPIPPLPSSRLIIDKKEDFSVSEMKRDGPTSYDSLINSAYNNYYQFQDDALLQRYLLTKDTSGLKGIPVIITSQEASSLFGKEFDIGKEPKDDSEKRIWLKNIQEKLNGHIYQACTRNSAEQTLLTKIQRDYAEIQNNKDIKDYKAPSLQHLHPATPCGDITIKQDTRTSAEKQLQAKAEEQQRKLGTYVAPEHYLTTFQIVGIMHAQPYSNYNASVESYIKNLLSPQDYSMSAIIPLQLYEKLPDNLKIDSRITLPSTASQEEQTKNFAMRILEFSSIDQARSFLSNEACAGMELKCAKPFSADPYGSNYLLIDEIGKLFRKIINIALPVLLGLALVIMWLTISRIMAENRKETAAYRAMGAKRSDIATIYFTYVLLIALRIAAISLILGIGIAYLTDQIYGARLNDIALSSFGIISDDIRFSLFNLSSPLIWAVVGIIFVVSMVASIQPLIRNVMRSPIQDMRED